MEELKPTKDVKQQILDVVASIQILMKSGSFEPPWNVSLSGHKKRNDADPTNDVLGVSFSTAYVERPKGGE
jgi:hypothetical protein